MGHDEGVAYGLEGLVAIRAAQGDAERPGCCSGAAERLRRRTGLVNAAGFTSTGRSSRRCARPAAGDELRRRDRRGRELPVAEVSPVSPR